MLDHRWFDDDGMRTRLSIAVVALLAVGMVACNDGSSGDSAETAEPGTSVPESSQDDGQADGTVVLESMPTVDSVAESDSLVSWEFRSSLTGELEQVVPWSDGFAALMDTDGDKTSGGGELWYSSDGVEWVLLRPFEQMDDIYALAGHDDQLFALTGDISDEASPQTLWQRRRGEPSGVEPWEEVMTDDALQGIAVNSDRLVAYAFDRFGILGVFDTATMEPVEFAGLPDVVLAEEAILGRVSALDEGFLATVGWPTDLDADQPDWILLHSPDGSNWERHPSPPPGGVGIPFGQPMAPTFEGRNLVGTFTTTSPPPGGAWVTDAGLAFEPIPRVADDVRSPAPAHLVELTNGTDAGFLGVVGGVVYQSFDGLEWDTLEPPPTWSELADFDGRGLAHGTILATDDSLIAVGVHGEFEGWVGLVNPSTDIWVARR